MLRVGRRVDILGSAGGKFDHGAFEERSRLVFVALTSNGTVAVFDPDHCVVVKTLVNHPGAAGVVAREGSVAVTNRGDGTLSLIEGHSLREVQRMPAGVRPNGVALGSRGIAVVGDLGDDDHAPALLICDLASGTTSSLSVPGQPKWCVMDGERNIAFCAISSPSMVLAVDAEKRELVASWPLPAAGAHGMDLDPLNRRLWVACDGMELLSLSADDGRVTGSWPLPGVPDATFFNPDTGRVHVAVADPGTVATVDPERPDRVELTPTGPSTKTSALVRPRQLFAFRPQTGDALELLDT